MHAIALRQHTLVISHSLLRLCVLLAWNMR